MTKMKTSGAAASDLQRMTVGDMGFLVDRMFGDCAPLQFVRELTKNSLDGIARNPDGSGVIHWDVDWNLFELSGEAETRKLCIIDTGVGMTGPEMVNYINKLSSSVHTQSNTGNFGVGAKIAAAPLNPAGMAYLSWKDGVGSMIKLMKDSGGDYGLQRFGDEFWTGLSPEAKPTDKDGRPIITEHGTMVVLFGDDEDASTMDPPAGSKPPSPNWWILRYLNGRFFEFPEKVSIKVRSGYMLPLSHEESQLRSASGMGPWLKRVSQSSGVVDLPETSSRIHWWLLAPVNGGPEAADVAALERSKEDYRYIRGGHTAALFQNELYEVASRNAGIAKLQQFGIVFGPQRVVLYLEPCVGKGSISANTARTSLIVDGDAIDWSAYAAEFRSLMPKELKDYQEEAVAALGQADHRKSIADRLKSVRDLYRFTRYRPKRGGAHLIPPEGGAGGTRSVATEREAGESQAGGRSSRSSGDLYALLTEPVGIEAEPVEASTQPDVTWTTAAEVGAGDRAARFVSGSNRILVNLEFRVFTEMTSRWAERYSEVAGARAVIDEVVREWFEQQLVETVMSALALKSGGRWSTEEIASLWDDNALTAAVLPRYHVDAQIKRVLGHRLGPLKPAS